MKLDELECFLEVVKQQNMTVAAKRLHRAQSTVSDRVQQLETQLGVSLFERSTRERRLNLTAAGRRLQAVAGQLMETAEDIRSEARFGRARPRPIRVGVNESVAHAWLGGWLARVRLEQPELAFDLKVATTDELDGMMVAGTLDLAIGTRGFGYRAVERRELVGQPMVFVGATARHDKPEYSLRELAVEGFITFQMASIAHQSLLELLRAECLDHCRVDTVSSVAIMLRLVEDGGGIATLPRLLVERANNPKLRILRCRTELQPIPLWVSWRAQRGRNPVADALTTLLVVLDGLASTEVPTASRRRGRPPSPRLA
jgi:DNA-binding transcriptional LysR family regulator